MFEKKDEIAFEKEGFTPKKIMAMSDMYQMKVA